MGEGRWHAIEPSPATPATLDRPAQLRIPIIFAFP
jgi:hypothetical protein